MIIQAENLRVEQRTGERLGTSTKLLEEEQMHGEAKVFARVALRVIANVKLTHFAEMELTHLE